MNNLHVIPRKTEAILNNSLENTGLELLEQFVEEDRLTPPSPLGLATLGDLLMTTAQQQSQAAREQVFGRSNKRLESDEAENELKTGRLEHHAA